MTAEANPLSGRYGRLARVRARVRWIDLIAAIGHQHRAALIGVSAPAAAFAVLLLIVALSAASSISSGTVTLLIMIMQLYAVMVSAFLAAPLVAGEYEHRTHLWAWSQDISRTRWFIGTAVPMLAVAAAWAATLGACAHMLTSRVAGAPSAASINPFDVPFFAADPLVQVGYALFAVALGLAFSTLIRRPTAAMALSFVTALVVRIALAFVARPRYLPPIQAVGSVNLQSGPVLMPPHSLFRGNGFLDAAGTHMPIPHSCMFNPSTSCLRAHGITARYVIFQPPERITEFHLVEFGIYAVLALLLMLTAWHLVRRVGTSVHARWLPAGRR